MGARDGLGGSAHGIGWTSFATYLNAQVVKKNRLRPSCQLHAHTAHKEVKKVDAGRGQSENQFKSRRFSCDHEIGTTVYAALRGKPKHERQP